MTQQPDLTEWDDDLTASAEDEYAALLRGQFAGPRGLGCCLCNAHRQKESG